MVDTICLLSLREFLDEYYLGLRDDSRSNNSIHNFDYISKDLGVRSIAFNVYGTEKDINENGDGTLYGRLVPTQVNEMEELILF